MHMNKDVQVKRHDCLSFRTGDWIVYHCQRCDFEYRQNWRTDEIKVRNHSPHILHYGGYYPEEYREALESCN